MPLTINKDECDDFYKRGLTNLKLEEWYKAKTNFEKAISLSSEKTIYYFYVAVAETENFSKLQILFQPKNTLFELISIPLNTEIY